MGIECMLHASLPNVYVHSVRAQYRLTGIRTTWTNIHKSCVLSIAYCMNIIHYYARST